MDENAAQEYQLNTYFGIFYPIELEDDVTRCCKMEPLLKGLVDDDAEITINDAMIFASRNSDFDARATIGFIVANDLTCEGKMGPRAAELYLETIPSEMIKAEKRYELAVNAVTDVFDILVKAFKKLNLPFRRLKYGWRTILMTWDV